jgi:hypothetical protein
MKGLCRLLVAAAALPLLGCSKEAVMRSGYETLHNISDSRNDIDPKYDASRPAFDNYRRQREEFLREQRPDESAKPVPARPAEP